MATHLYGQVWVGVGVIVKPRALTRRLNYLIEREEFSTKLYPSIFGFLDPNESAIGFRIYCIINGITYIYMYHKYTLYSC